jgi:hypothetical protein
MQWSGHPRGTFGSEQAGKQSWGVSWKQKIAPDCLRGHGEALGQMQVASSSTVKAHFFFNQHDSGDVDALGTGF